MTQLKSLVEDFDEMGKTRDEIQDYSIDIVADVHALDDEAPGRLLEALESVDSGGAVVHSGPARIGAQFFVSVRQSPEEATRYAIDLFFEALEKAHISGEFASIAMVSGKEFERALMEQPESYAGVTEVAGLLGVSRQRVSELRGSGILPAPVAELAAGPVWLVSSLQRFVATWERKPGRPRRAG